MQSSDAVTRGSHRSREVVMGQLGQQPRMAKRESDVGERSASEASQSCSFGMTQSRKTTTFTSAAIAIETIKICTYSQTLAIGHWLSLNIGGGGDAIRM
jgi:hypothetical protein